MRLDARGRRAALGVTLRNFQNYEAGKYAPPDTVRRLMTVIFQGLAPAPWDLEGGGTINRRRR